MSIESGTQVDFQRMKFENQRVSELDYGEAVVRPVVVVGAGPVGLATAVDLAQQGIQVILLDNDDGLSVGSRAICFAKRTLEIFDRLGCGQRMVDKGVSWNVGKVFLQDEQLYSFNLLPETGHSRPAFINLQQYYVEGFLVERAAQFENIEIRWKNEVTSLEQHEDHVALTVTTPDGEYVLRAQYLVAADGSRSAIRKGLGLESSGRTFKDRFLIADVKMTAPFPTERWFWFDPPFHRNQSVLLHRQPDNVWRIDFQLGWDADPVAEKQPERVIPRVKALLGEDAEFTLEWVSVYTFSCLRMDKFRHGRVLFAGDSAHGVSPFGARGANSGVQDADNLAWKLKLVLDGQAPDSLLDTYASEREYAADENILNSTRATDFITPKSSISHTFRDATLKLAKNCPFARRLVNSGRLSVPAVLHDTPLNTPDKTNETFFGTVALGAVSPDAPIYINGRQSWFLERTAGKGFTAMYFSSAGEDLTNVIEQFSHLSKKRVPVNLVVVAPQGADVSAAFQTDGVTTVEDAEGLLTKRFDAQPKSLYLLRPDQHLCARWRTWTDGDVLAALNRVTCNG